MGCATAFALTRRGIAVTLFEASARLDGTIGSVREQGFLADDGIAGAEALAELVYTSTHVAD